MGVKPTLKECDNPYARMWWNGWLVGVLSALIVATLLAWLMFWLGGYSVRAGW